MSITTDILALSRPRKRQWLPEKSLDTLDAKKKTKLQNNQHEYRRLKGMFKSIAKDDLENFYNGLDDEAEEYVTHKTCDQHTASSLECVSVRLNNASNVPPPKFDDTSCASADETLNCWRDHYQTMLNHTPADTCQDLETQSQLLQHHALIFMKDEPTFGEVEKVIRKLKNFQAAVPDGISPELLKYEEEHDGRAHHEFFHKVWITGRVTIEWKEGVIVSQCK